jgi:hypothetical protein
MSEEDNSYINDENDSYISDENDNYTSDDNNSENQEYSIYNNNYILEHNNYNTESDTESDTESEHISNIDKKLINLVTNKYKYIENDNLRIATNLLTNGANPNIKYGIYNIPIFLLSIKNGLLDIAKILLNYGANAHSIDIYGSNAILYICNFCSFYTI